MIKEEEKYTCIMLSNSEVCSSSLRMGSFALNLLTDVAKLLKVR